MMPVSVHIIIIIGMNVVDNLNSVKGTVAQDFLATVFFMDLLDMGLRFRG
jgi:hypothetical protein